MYLKRLMRECLCKHIQTQLRRTIITQDLSYCIGNSTTSALWHYDQLRQMKPDTINER